MDTTNQKLADAACALSETANIEALTPSATAEAKTKAIELRKTAHETTVLAELSQATKITHVAPVSSLFIWFSIELRSRSREFLSRLGTTIMDTGGV